MQKSRSMSIRRTAQKISVEILHEDPNILLRFVLTIVDVNGRVFKQTKLPSLTERPRYPGRPSPSTNEVPAHALLGYRPTLRIDVSNLPYPSSIEAIHRAKETQAMQEKIQKQLEKAKTAQKAYYDSKHSAKRFHVGDWVLLNAKNFRMLCPTRKLDHKFVGPFQIIESWNTQVVQ
ncbi:uncharacterized protein PADG_12314 [Paracoccidioides brasiliensis Pb18]|uniref:Integrase zinc-binding domain-containing protein n=1 Tax=Paracoccidioides brasiliensis (strain Pb18) TaxID=502780 RepID=A0A0A0HW24_PARBD|nr:uncharacterized protein PADG_12314 [Paracoccidioides brasiliensis Pb18]KGM91630.1 hypothetical protein PADG_12314 [Paracoccidioides brasiliensis Pb18]